MAVPIDKKLAVLIDADNTSADIIEPLLAEIAKYGISSVKRIYGDWSNGLNKWKEALLPHAIIPVQQFAYTKGKNATDMAMVIDAMDLLYSNTFDGFCLVSSDSDFTRLASRIRENGLTVYGFGEKKTPEAFRKACDNFIYTENLINTPSTLAEEQYRPSEITHASNIQSDTHILTLILRAVKETADEDGWAELGAVGNYIGKINPDFDHRSYGFSKFSNLVKSLDGFETRSGSSGKGLYVRKQGYRRFIRLIQEIINEKSNEHGYIRLNVLCSNIKHRDPHFNSQSFGCKTVSEAVRSIHHSNWVEIITLQDGLEYAHTIKKMI